MSAKIYQGYVLQSMDESTFEIACEHCGKHSRWTYVLRHVGTYETVTLCWDCYGKWQEGTLK